ncbi:hypothetical protein [Caproicibacterium lactatifermentans]|uniref:Uncharacterized protein n=1 Tax=Caproicibacterium lactatifermentans TaxID=2666138 RepID=A0A859DNW7_9FIRM|nr:hypothetical protein [Caproicibacterium lactatifermentans]QKN23450.1 hypothetical protein GJQ69_02450 [Caproicibacterium lactatifermentans]
MIYSLISSAFLQKMCSGVLHKMDDTLAVPMVLRALGKAFQTAKPEILNSDRPGLIHFALA